MADHRPFPPSPRRLALARASGITAASPLLVGAAALVGAAVVLVNLGRAAATQLGRWIVAAVNASDATAVAPVTNAAADSIGHASTPSVNPEASNGSELAAVLDLGRAARAVLELALPVLTAAAIAALVIHVAQTRALWLPHRRIAGAPRVPRHVASRTMFELACASVIAFVTFGWLWLTAPQLASLVQSPSATGLAIASLVIALAIACIALGVLDALLRHVQLASALAMTRDEKREDDRLAAADPRWRAQRLAVLRGPSVADAIARAAVVLVGDDIAIAIDWDAKRQPVPLRTATGRRTRAQQLIALARRQRVPIHRDVELATALVSANGPVPDTHWARLAEIVAAVGSRR